MYKVIVINANNLGSLEDELNAARADGYRPVYFWSPDSRLVIVLEMAPKAGRPPKSKDEMSLGE